jgi:uncharacterized protein YndB with AHSA1/START domain
MSTSFRLELHIAAPPAAPFAALTEPATMQEWLAEHADVALADGRYAFWGRDVPMTRDPGHQRLLDVEDERRLRFRMGAGRRRHRGRARPRARWRRR